MFDFAWSEIMVIALIALVVIGPKDLPRVLRSLGKWASRARMIAREFQGSIDQMIRESELDEVRREVQKVAAIDLDHQIKSTVDPTGELGKELSSPTALPAEPAKEPPAIASGTGELEPPSETASPAVTPAPPSDTAPPAETPAPSAPAEHDHDKTPTPA